MAKTSRVSGFENLSLPEAKAKIKRFERFKAIRKFLDEMGAPPPTNKRIPKKRAPPPPSDPFKKKKKK